MSRAEEKGAIEQMGGVQGWGGGGGRKDILCMLSHCHHLSRGTRHCELKRFLHFRLIKMSSPRVNNIIIIGCIVMYSTVFFLLVRGFSLDDDTFVVTCYVSQSVLQCI